MSATVREMREADLKAALGAGGSITVRVEDIDAHCKRARDHGARITEGPVTHPYGERQYNAVDFAGYSWTFSESVADVHPQDWGRDSGATVAPRSEKQRRTSVIGAFSGPYPPKLHTT